MVIFFQKIVKGSPYVSMAVDTIYNSCSALFLLLQTASSKPCFFRQFLDLLCIIIFFQMGSCHLGWSFYAALGGMVGSFLCAFLSHQAEASAQCEKVENDVMDGKNPVCAI